ncbi:MAG: 16S rRNA (cytosine(1402)-N(4))-methyltransferase RsmH [Candidatus Sungbacteria bacterium]|nr:16S rRNA (cytosine(1402)-N(4))-methyltransferase RsmH [Candidatus Sungbacteria bacterium]
MHTPVLLQEVLHYLNPEANEDVIDATVNGGGHAEVLLERIAPKGRLLGIDRDPSILAGTKERLKKFGDRMMVARGNFANIAILAKENGVLHPSSILFDLGTSSYHLASDRGFSFQRDEPLDMRYNPEDEELTAEAIINHAPLSELERIFKTYGEERKARRVAEAVVKERRHRAIKTTKELAALIEKILPRGRIHPATRIFQALRIAVNDELGNAEKGILEAIKTLKPGGKLAVISFHSGEDRVVKQIFKESQKKSEGEILTPKPITATRSEITENPRSRSAKLRAFKKN